MKRVLTAAVVIALAMPAAAALGAPAPSKFPDVVNTSTTLASGDRVLRLAVDLDAPPAAVWAAFTDPAAIHRWTAPLAIIDLRNGGAMEESYSATAKPGDADNIRHEIIAVSPGRLLVFHNTNAPHQLPGREAYKKVVSILQVDDLGAGRSRLVLTQTGYAPGADYDGLYAFFSEDNAELMQDLKAQLEKPDGKLHSLVAAR